MNANRKRPVRVYVKVNSSFDETGYMQPTAIIWSDGRVFKIESVHDFRSAISFHDSRKSDCYTVVINGEFKYLYFEKADSHTPSRFGRWFVESMKSSKKYSCLKAWW